MATGSKHDDANKGAKGNSGVKPKPEQQGGPVPGVPCTQPGKKY